MKILTNENGKNKLYIQTCDLRYLGYNNFSISNENLRKAIIRVEDMKEKEYYQEKYSFIETSDPEEIVILNDVEGIIDYNEYIDMSVDELKDEISKVKMGFSELAEKSYNSKINVREKLNEYSYKIESLEKMIDLKCGKINFNFPLVMKKNGFVAESNGFRIYEAVDPNVIIIDRIDGKETSSSEIPASIFQKNIGIIIANDKNKEKYLDGYGATLRTTNDNKKVYITLKQKNLEQQLDSNIRK